jgi:hypothetical protein
MSDTLEYLFFTREIADQFIQSLKDKNLCWKERKDSIHGNIIIHIPEDDIGDHWDDVDDDYDKLAQEDQRQKELGINNEDDVSTAGIYIQLKNGKQTVAQVNPDVLGRILSVIDSDEFAEFVDIIAKSIEEPDDAPICKRQNI